MDESKFEPKALTKAAGWALLGQLAFFAEFLEVSGVLDRWVAGCPLGYASPNAPAVADVLGTWLLSILDGPRRYTHVTGPRGDTVAPEILGTHKIISPAQIRNLTPIRLSGA